VVGLGKDVDGLGVLHRGEYGLPVSWGDKLVFLTVKDENSPHRTDAREKLLTAKILEKEGRRGPGSEKPLLEVPQMRGRGPDAHAPDT
jgi:hypothetical protein